MIGTRIRRLRTAKGMTQRELASPMYTHAYISTIEAGRRQPSRRALEYFAQKLGVDADELLTGRPADLEPRLELRLQEARVALSSGRLDEADEAFSRVAREARRYRLTRLQARAEEGQGLLLERRGRPQEALERYQEADRLLRSEPPAARAEAVSGMAHCLEALGDVRYAVFLLESLLDEMERDEAQDPQALARVHASLVDAYLDAGLPARAAASGAELERLAPKLTDGLRVATMHMNVARLYLTQGRVEEAQRSLQRAEDLYRQLRLETEIGYAHLARGYLLSREGRCAEARSDLLEAIRILEDVADGKNLTRALNELGRVERLEGRTDRAVELLERSIALLGDSDTSTLAWAHRELGLTLRARDAGLAEKHIRRAIELYERAEQVMDLAVTYRALGDLLHERGDAEGGSQAYRAGIAALEPLP
ncbi:MAG: helix-turn-helix domain-containing protein [Candidatus Velamenicoccus archaeovorus]